ncbi:hypothetical protein, partial [Blautia wexlerae]|uniref:hypothetical protein n=1 Tax=Blautia wexlerae TaxID=418240 RepID=UPI0032F0941B
DHLCAEQFLSLSCTFLPPVFPFIEVYCLCTLQLPYHVLYGYYVEKQGEYTFLYLQKMPFNHNQAVKPK